MKKSILMLLCLIVAMFGNASAQKFLGKTLKESSKTDQEKDGFVYKWYEYKYLRGKDTLYAAFDLNGNRLTPNSDFVNDKHQGHKPWYCGGEIFSCVIGKQGFPGGGFYVGYKRGKLVFPASLELTFIYYDDGLFKLSKISSSNREIEAIYNSLGECIIPFTLEYNKIYVENPKYNRIICYYTDANDNYTGTYTYTRDGQYYAEGGYWPDGFGEKDTREFNSKKRPASSHPRLNSSSINYSYSGSNTGNSSYASSNSEPGLIIKGIYTVVTDGTPLLSTFSVYEDRLSDGSSIYKYKSTNSSGERVYSGMGWFNTFHTFYVNPKTGNIRLVKRFDTPYGSNNVTCEVTKGSDLYINGDFRPGGNPTGGYTPSTSSPSNSNSSTTTNPVQPHQRTKDCAQCHGSGKCSSCNGTHRINYKFGTGTIECPNCKPNGACSSCGGSGKKTTTEYY